ncbi:MAG: PAS domain-containing sensor histidine kinase [Pseudomonadota bacterium]
MIEQSRDHAFVLLDPCGQILAWRGGASHILGYTEEEAVGQPASFIFTPEDNALGLSELELRVATARGRCEDDRWHVRKDGLRVWIGGIVTALHVDDELVGYVKVMRDRTDARGQLDTYRNRSEQSGRRLADQDAVFARVAHEIRNALGPIRNSARLTERSPDERQRQMAVSIIDRQVGVLDRMIRDLTDAARISAGKLELKRQPINLAEALVVTVEAVRNRALQKEQTLAEFLPTAPLMVNADLERVHQIVFNLLDNAIKYTPSGGSIWLKCTLEDDDAVIRIQDTGVGIPAELLPVIFEMFTQETPQDSEGGYGIGLSLVKELVQAHEGVVEVRSDGRGKGAEFTVRLPMTGRHSGPVLVERGPEHL